MTEKGLIYLACMLVVIVLVSATFALWRISSNLRGIATRLIETNDNLQNICFTQARAERTISSDIKSVSEATHNVYESMFSNAEVTIRRNGIEENDDDDI